MKQVWIQSGNKFFIGEDSSKRELLEPGIYNICNDPFENLYLEQVGDKFLFTHKIYGLEKDFIQRVVRTYGATSGNLGVLLNGVQGTGKTVTGKLVANELNLPILMVTADFAKITSFLTSIQQDVIVFIDEYEKIFEQSGRLLTIMDGMLSSDHRRVFILTTNDTFINRNLTQRPSRIRYIKQYGDLTKSVIEEVVDDILLWPEHREGIIQFVSGLDIINIDLVKAVVNEVNIHNEDPSNFKDIFNVKNFDRNVRYDIFQISGGKEKKIYSGAKVNVKISSAAEGNNLYIQDPGYISVGQVIKYMGKGRLMVGRVPVLADNPEITQLEYMSSKDRIFKIDEDGDHVEELLEEAGATTRKRSRKAKKQEYRSSLKPIVLEFRESYATHYNYMAF